MFTARHHGAGQVIRRAPNHWQLLLPAAAAFTYHLAQLDDYHERPRRAFPHSPPQRFTWQARASAPNLPGTWGFGLWNDPFGLRLGFGGKAWRLPTLPQAAWFFHASPENHLSFTPHLPANGFLAQVFASRGSPRLLWGAILYPFAPERTRRILAEHIAESVTRLSLDVTTWHEYSLEWKADGVRFTVDGRTVLESSISPTPPLAQVIWIDNQFAAFPPGQRLRSGLLAVSQTAWIEIKV